MKNLLIAALGFSFLCFSGAFIAEKVSDPKPISAVGLAVCGHITGVVITYSDGSQKAYTQDEVDAALPDIEKLPKEHTGLLAWSGPLCSPRPQVY
jgi:hypothetical protein